MSQRAVMLGRMEQASAGLRGAWSVRDFDPAHDADAVRRLDTSYTSGQAYTVHRSGDVVAIAPTAISAPHTGRVAIDLDDGARRGMRDPGDPGAPPARVAGGNRSAIASTPPSSTDSAAIRQPQNLPRSRRPGEPDAPELAVDAARDLDPGPGAVRSWTHARVAVLDGRVRGFVAWRCEPDGRMAIVHFHIDRPYRRRGGGRQLLDDALDRAHQAGATLAWLETSSANHPAIAAARRLGFEICGFDTTLYRGTALHGEVAVYMAHLIDGDART